jgi:hypothetical protein
VDSEKRWKKAGPEDDFFCCPSHADKDIYYARMYTPGKGFSHSDTNQFIANFQMGRRASASRLPYREGAIQTFANEVSDFLKTGSRKDKSFLITPIPCSKHRQHRDYDDRIDLVAQRIAAVCSHVQYFPVLYSDKMPTFHTLQGSRNWRLVYDALRIDSKVRGMHKKGKTIIVIDDVTTSGAHFEGARVLLTETFSENDVMGIFWAKSKANP